MSNLGKKFTQWVDPKLEKYREPKEPETPPPYVPESLEDFVGVLQRTPETILSAKDRARISACMSFADRKVSDVMIPKDEVIFVYEHDFLGPLMLDKLYKSGAAHFPVLSSDGRRVIGVISTEQLNSLEIKKTDRATKYLSHRVYFLREDYTLEQALSAFLRTNCFFFVVVDKSGLVVGELTYDILVACMIGYIPHDDFHDDNTISAVLKRNMV